MSGWKQYVNTTDFTVIHNENTVELRVHTSTTSVPKNGNWNNLGNPGFPALPKESVCAPSIPQPLAIIFVGTNGNIQLGSINSAAFNAEIHATLRWSK